MVDQLDHSVNLGFSLLTFRLQVIESTRLHLQSFRFLPVPASIWNNPGFFPSRNSMCSIGLWQSKNLQEFFSICYGISLPVVDTIHVPQGNPPATTTRNRPTCRKSSLSSMAREQSQSSSEFAMTCTRIPKPVSSGSSQNTGSRQEKLIPIHTIVSNRRNCRKAV